MNRHIQKLLNKKIALVGLAHQEQPYIKAMLVSRREGNCVFYFDTNNGSQSVSQWKDNPKSCLYFFNNLLFRGVTLFGTIEIINDIELKRKHWKPSMRKVYPGGVDDPDYCIAKFTATKGRYYFMYRAEDFTL